MKYAAKKLGMMLLTMLIVSFITFLAFQIITGDPTNTLLGSEATPERVEALREELGLNPLRRGLTAQQGIGGIAGDDLEGQKCYKRDDQHGQQHPA